MKLRAVQFADAELLFGWRNDPATRENSHNTQPVDWDSHVAWLKASLENPRRKLRIAEIDSVSVATVRADQSEPDLWELSWTVAPEHRGRGHGKDAVRLLIAEFPQGTRFLAEVKDFNVASQRIAEAAGMKVVKQRDHLLIFAR